MRQVESSFERSRRLQDKETAARINTSIERMSTVLEQFRFSDTETKNELRKIVSEYESSKIYARLVKLT